MNNEKIDYKKIIEELEADNRHICDISHRGGTFGFWASDAIGELFPNLECEEKSDVVEALPQKLGAYCNYLGGGLRGAVCVSGSASDFISHGVPEDKAEIIAEFLLAVRERYTEIENETYLNEEEDEDGETNWDAIGTNASRRAGVVSAY